jgi:hypothetical protein
LGPFEPPLPGNAQKPKNVTPPQKKKKNTRGVGGFSMASVHVRGRRTCFFFFESRRRALLAPPATSASPGPSPPLLPPHYPPPSAGRLPGWGAGVEHRC